MERNKKLAASIGAVLMVQGTASDVGKSVIVTALCRIFVQDGLRPAPFKSQNMALNSYVTPDGKEIGRAQGTQAEACGIAATTDMNPVLLKPTGDMHSQIVVHGRPHQHLSAVKYREEFLPQAKPLVMEALNRLRQQYDIVVMEGAGSPAEINLKHRDIVNMNLAGWADAPVILIGDIDRGGVFAFFVGTLELLEPHERARVKGFIINKFRGDVSLLKPGLDWLKQRTGIPVLGVIPFMPDMDIDAEDSVVLDTYDSARPALGQAELDIAVIRYPRISNFTDFAPLVAEPDVSVRYVDKAADLGRPDVIILPGTKDTLGDLDYLRRQGLEQEISGHLQRGTHTQLVGICGGYQMLGEQLHDPEGVEAMASRWAPGLGWLPLSTTFLPGKKTVRVQGTMLDDSPLRLNMTDRQFLIEGYEIHAGVTIPVSAQDISVSVASLFAVRSIQDTSRNAQAEDARAERDSLGQDMADQDRQRDLHAGGEVHLEGASRSDGRVFETYLHGLFHNDDWRRAWLNGIRVSKGLAPLEATISMAARKEEAFDRLADHVRAHLHMKKLYEIAGIQPESEA